ncbi:nitroreductase family protein [Caproicibacterium sp. XB2]|jgi:hypothetical protein|uniref:nitroreductase family protein n=1 Tax=Caproicibacterium sp. XB2 TaxID=3388458 RepID=UPI000A2941F8|nr:nitroreductase [Ruminococcaceae bacterium CPB6]
MNLAEAIRARHAVRSYTDRKISSSILEQLQIEVDTCNRESGLHIQLITDEPEAFGGLTARFGNFSGITNYLGMVGKVSFDLGELAGYYGERLVLKAQQLGLNSCWVAASFRKSKCAAKVVPGEKLVCVIPIGYGKTQGVPHKSKPMQELCKVEGPMPDWFHAGMEAAMLAPTALNRQKFCFTLTNGKADVASNGGFYSDIDLGIVRYHFAAGAGREHCRW